MSEFKPGARLRSAVCSTEVMVIVVPDGEINISCGGAAMLAEGETGGQDLAIDDAASAGSQLGKRYTDEGGALELLCVKPGTGALALNGVPLVIKGAKPLPSSD